MHILQCWMDLNSFCVCVSWQPWAFQAREFMRKKVIGKEVCFTVENKTPQGREYGMVYLGKGKRRLQPLHSGVLPNIQEHLFLFWHVYFGVVIVTCLIWIRSLQRHIRRKYCRIPGGWGSCYGSQRRHQRKQVRNIHFPPAPWIGVTMVLALIVKSLTM